MHGKGEGCVVVEGNVPSLRSALTFELKCLKSEPHKIHKNFSEYAV